ncbi:MAG: hypothetical protein GYA57_15575 [Myxococcales bacterium]|nr:hypothetical protein [Myxococcales bacterium]
MARARPRIPSIPGIPLAAATIVAAAACDESAPDPCAGVDCSGHGVCTAAGGAPFCDCDWGFEPDGLQCRPEGENAFEDRFDTPGEPDPARWSVHDFSTGNPAEKSAVARDGRLRITASTALYGASEEYGLRSVPYFLIHNDSELVLETPTRPPQPETGVFPAALFLSDDPGPDTFVHTGCSEAGCPAIVGSGKRGLGLLVARSSPAACGTHAEYTVVHRAHPGPTGLERLPFACSRLPGTTDFRSVRLEISASSVELWEHGELLGSWPNPVPDLAGGRLFLAAFSDQERYPDIAEFDDVRVFCKGRCADTDFRSDPGWTATTPERCRWSDLEGGVLEVTSFIQSEDVCATGVPWTGRPFTLEFDFRMTLLGWAAEWRFGLWDETMDLENSRQIALGLGCADGGGLWNVLACNQWAQTYVTEYRPPPHDDCVLPDPDWMSVRIDYDGASVHAVVRDRRTGDVLHERTLDDVECPDPLPRLGFSMVGFYRPGYGDMYSTGYLDNVRLSYR